MRRINIAPRKDWQKRLEDLGCSYYLTEGELYWDERKYYSFSMDEIDKIEDATNELYRVFNEAAGHVIKNNRFKELNISDRMADLIRDSWHSENAISVYGRFDLAYDGSRLKALEFNADTPTSLYEAAVLQWFWKEEVKKEADQFNSIHERLINAWTKAKKRSYSRVLHLCHLSDNEEDFTTTAYMKEVADQAGWETKQLTMEQIGWNHEMKQFIDLEGHRINTIFKLYPWEWLETDSFWSNLYETSRDTVWIEPAYKGLLSNKGLMAIAWELFPDHPNLLETYIGRQESMQEYVRKPFLSREGANITIVGYGISAQNDGPYTGPSIYQRYFQLAEFEGFTTTLGSWIVDNVACGMGIRESDSLITTNCSRFVPHVIE